MKNKKWKRHAKRLKGRAETNCRCYFCDLIGYTCFGACCGGIRKLEKRVKNYNNLSANNKQKSYNIM